jgi:hypothetical protein
MASGAVPTAMSTGAPGGSTSHLTTRAPPSSVEVAPLTTVVTDR